MNWDLASLDQLWRSPSFPMWLTLAAAAFFGIVVLVTLLRAERSVANGALTVITLAAIAVAAAATLRGPGSAVALSESHPPVQVGAALPQLSCIDDLAGDAVLTACEKTLFGTADSAAAAVAYAASQITRLTSEAAAPDKTASTELLALRRAVERDRYGLMAYVLMARDHCTPAACPAFSALADKRQVASNMTERLYENLITRYAPSWNAPPPPAIAAAPAPGLLAGLPPSMPTGKPTTAEFPSSAQTPPISIMNPEPPASARSAPPPAAAAAPAAPATRPAAAAPATAGSPTVAAKKPPAPKRPPAAPVQIAPAPASSTAAAPADD